jgi:hypothetical protein
VTPNPAVPLPDSPPDSAAGPVASPPPIATGPRAATSCKTCGAGLPPCKSGKGRVRRLCDACRVDARRAARRRWGKTEAGRAAARRYRETHRKKAREQRRASYWANPELARAKNRAWRLANPERSKALQDRYRRTPCVRCGKVRTLAGARSKRPALCRECKPRMGPVPVLCSWCGKGFTMPVDEARSHHRHWHPDCLGSMTRAAANLGITRERVRQLVAKEYERANRDGNHNTRAEALAVVMLRRGWLV